MIRLRNAFLVATSATILFFVNCTIIAVVELGKVNVVHRSAYSSTTTSADDIYSFWKSMHNFNDESISHRKSLSLKFPNMEVVPHLINSADGGLVVGIVLNNVDMASMPTISNSLKENEAVGHLHVNGTNVESIMENIKGQVVDTTSFENSIVKMLNSSLYSDANKLESIVVKLDDNASAAIVDSAFARVLQVIMKETSITGKTIVIYIIVDEEVILPHQDIISRRLSDDNNEGQDENEEEENRNEEDKNGEEEEENRNEEDKNGEEEENRNDEGEQERDEEGNQQNYYNEGNFQGQNKYGYINAYGEWITTYKSMFHIQYSNVLLWTSIILILSVIISTGMMIYMPLMPDTLLFGESAKMVVE